MSSDFDWEFEMAMMNNKLAPDIELVCLMASLKYQFLSSTLLKEVAELGGDLTGMVPKHVATALRKKFPSQASGKYQGTNTKVKLSG
jgi:pantetheine-phosphate adenylyltransferase